MRRRCLYAILGLFSGICVGTGAVAQNAPACAAVVQAQQFYNDGNLEALHRQWSVARNDLGCLPQDRAQVAFNLGVLMARHAMAGPEADREAKLLEASRIGAEPYPVEYLLGDLYAVRKDWVQALTRYNNVIRHMEFSGPMVSALTPAEAETLLNKWQTALMIVMIGRNSGNDAARKAAQVPRGRDGRPGKAMAGKVRENTVARSNIPVNFVWDSDEFIPGGEDYVKELAGSLKSIDAPSVTLVGNADVTGQGSDIDRDQYNCRLSRDRVKRVEAVLRQQGYTGSIVLVAMGHRMPFQPEFGRESFTRHELDGMDRRVETSLTLSRKDYPNACE